MTKGFHKKLSKRITCKRRYKVEKKVRDHNKKLKKLAKKNPMKKPKAKDPGIPNSLPFKEEVIKEALLMKADDDQRKALVRKEFHKSQRTNRDSKLDEFRGITTVDGSDLSTLVKKAENRAKEFAKNVPLGIEGSQSSASNLSAYYKEFQKVVEAADVIIQVVDARDPLGTRCPEVEKCVLASGADKRLVILINKVDLIPRENLDKWLVYLRNEFPTIAFKASTQSQKSNIGRSRKSVSFSTSEDLNTSKCVGAKMLMTLLGNYRINNGIKTCIKVGIVGFPNVGKSSVINSLKRSRACTVGSTPGLTKTAQEVSLDKYIKLIDSPGIVFAKMNQFPELNGTNSKLITSILALRNATKVETLEDPITPVEAIINRIRKEDLMLFYVIPDYSNVDEFLNLIAKRFGKLKKGGVANISMAARKVLNDWNLGKIKYFTLPPDSHTMPSHINSEIVNTFSDGFKLDPEIEDEEMKNLLTSSEDAFTLSALSEPSLLSSFEDQEMELPDEVIPSSDDDMAVDDIKSVIAQSTQIVMKPRKMKGKKVNDVEMKESSQDLKGLQLNKNKRVQFKKEQKRKKRLNKVSDKLASSLKQNTSLENYSFETDFV